AFRQISLFEAAGELLKEGTIKGKGRAWMEEFLSAIKSWNEVATTARASEVLRRVLADTRYKTEGVGDPNSIDGASRVENVEEMEQVVAEFEQSNAEHTVSGFLEEMLLDAQ